MRVPSHLARAVRRKDRRVSLVWDRRAGVFSLLYKSPNSGRIELLRTLPSGVWPNVANTVGWLAAHDGGQTRHRWHLDCLMDGLGVGREGREAVESTVQRRAWVRGELAPYLKWWFRRNVAWK